MTGRVHACFDDTYDLRRLSFYNHSEALARKMAPIFSTWTNVKIVVLSFQVSHRMSLLFSYVVDNSNSILKTASLISSS